MRNLPFEAIFKELANTNFAIGLPIHRGEITQRNNYPPCNIIVENDGNRNVVEFALAGYSIDDVDVSVANNVLTISGENNDTTEHEYLHQGIAKRAFEHKFTLSPYHIVSEATMVNGMLRVTVDYELPEEAKPKQITIKSK